MKHNGKTLHSIYAIFRVFFLFLLISHLSSHPPKVKSLLQEKTCKEMMNQSVALLPKAVLFF